MTRSMTGFAHRELRSSVVQGSMILKSYNNRYLDLSIALPAQLSALEPRFREFLQAHIVHGKVELSLHVRELDLPVRASADLGAAKEVSKVLNEIREACGIAAPLSLKDLLSFDGVVAYERDLDEEELWKLLEPELAACFAAYDESRLREGEATRVDIEGQLARIEAGLAVVESKVGEIEATLKSQLLARFKEIMGDAVDENRVLAEVAALLMKYTVNEEVTRLKSHISTFHRTIEKEEAIGKKLDFLCQEMGREVNTIGSKNILIPVAEVVVEMKDSLENIREQLRNIE
jgi:uncharacterized protein (TIGR00255 family)